MNEASIGAPPLPSAPRSVGKLGDTANCAESRFYICRRLEVAHIAPLLWGRCDSALQKRLKGDTPNPPKNCDSPPYLRSASPREGRKSECAPARKNSPPGRF